MASKRKLWATQFPTGGGYRMRHESKAAVYRYVEGKVASGTGRAGRHTSGSTSPTSPPVISMASSQPKIPQWLRDHEDAEVAKHNPPPPPVTDGCAWTGGDCQDDQSGCPHC